MKNQNKFNELAEKPVGRLLASYALPAIVAMTASSIYNIVDGFFIVQGVVEHSSMGLALTSPLMSLTAAFGAMVGVGAATLMSIRLGQKDYGTARKILGNVVLMNVAMGLLLGIILQVFLTPILTFFGASADTLPYAHEFMTVILAGNVVTHLYFGLNAMLRSTNRPKLAMYSTFGTVGINLVLAPIFIFVFEWGISGAAWATVVAQLCMLIWQLRLFSNKADFIHLERSTLRPEPRIMRESLLIGLPQFLVNACACLVAVVITRSMSTYGGDVAVGAFGISNRLISVVKLTILFATLITTTGFAVGVFFPEPCVAVFAKDAPELVAEAAHGFSIAVLFFPFVGMQIVSTAFFQSIGMAGKSIFLSLTRQMLFLLPALFILPHFFERPTDGVWWSGPVSDAMASILSAVLLVTPFRKLRAKQLNVCEKSE